MDTPAPCYQQAPPPISPHNFSDTSPANSPDPARCRRRRHCHRLAHYPSLYPSTACSCSGARALASVLRAGPRSARPAAAATATATAPLLRIAHLALLVRLVRRCRCRRRHHEPRPPRHKRDVGHQQRVQLHDDVADAALAPAAVACHLARAFRVYEAADPENRLPPADLRGRPADGFSVLEALRVADQALQVVDQRVLRRVADAAVPRVLVLLAGLRLARVPR
ncbi:hypothetical protein AYI69_g8072 [Smittium culicis]|uniref:Uncharacterized protein n=1 Tax=Smittium culicis TaxID=133412 RepID=A0A1R1XMD3_9FUNG|nr:hypothetical protein AYI69_g8072 [Smittium culicis]